MTTTTLADAGKTAPVALQRVRLVLAAVPLLAVGLLYLFAWDTSRAFGAWPTYGNPDPKDANSLLHLFSGVGILLSIPSFLLLCLLAPAAHGRQTTRRDTLTLVAGAIGLLLLFVTLAGNLGTWFMD
jgi:hypothetical protein